MTKEQRRQKEESDIKTLAKLLERSVISISCEYLIVPNPTDEELIARWLYDNGYRYIKRADRVRKRNNGKNNNT